MLYALDDFEFDSIYQRVWGTFAWGTIDMPAKRTIGTAEWGVQQKLIDPLNSSTFKYVLFE